MSKLIAMASVGLLVLIGCGQAEEPERPIVWRAAPLISLGTDAISQQLSVERIASAPLNGKIVEKKIVQDGSDNFQYYVVESRNSAMLAEADVYTELSRKGYTRQVKEQTGDVFSVDYVKHGDVTISALYTSLDEAKPASNGAKSRIVFTWKVSA